MTSLTRILSILLTPVLASVPIWAETPAIQPPANDTEASALELRVVQSDEGALVNSPSSKGFTVEVTNGHGAPVSEVAVAFRLPDSGPTGTFADGSHARVVYTDLSGRASVSGLQWGAFAGTVEIHVTAVKGTLHSALSISTSLAGQNDNALVQPAASSNKPAITQPGVTASSVKPAIAQSGASGPAIQPVQTSASSDEPTVSITNEPGANTGAGSNNKKKWLLIAAVGVGAGVGAALAFHGGGSSTATPIVSVGTPTISVGHIRFSRGH